MTLILAFIAAHMGFLWEEACFRIVGSEVTTINGGDALLVVESQSVRMRFVRDRGQLFLDLQPLEGGKPEEWFSIDLIRRLQFGRPEASAELDPGYASFVRDGLDDIEASFREPAWRSTGAKLRNLKAKRAKEMFG
jgi:hypothetical protein